ncbi:hypothetical protein [Halobacillus litoralis]|uniref:hypothetical protein n=1 Tax=Halobacillus litoralis TaxID=45668 RepID=UPI001CFE1195|nr:hypothetical protein [Halobacillus litoralis]
MDGLINLLHYLISRKKKCVYMTHIEKEYYRITSKLIAAGVKYRVATVNNTSSTWSAFGSSREFNTEYKFYVRKRDAYNAERAIYKSDKG